ncbi:adenylate/guanylate cyclase domain-containing protein [Ensifer sp.]|jgi:class 3 adenylate cyclase/TolB-like protein|uniref:adenylate/guanylate cyclase domain-containing protein n=1 Tax=Ensifer sp. TaxID=1872086 RepID=UPI002E10C545|nr:adenylate/guanylate cyclase domain-containing protein [Ensifer sp.]
MEQKLSVIMAADVVGYSRLMEVDEKGTLAALMAHRQELLDVEVASHDGRIVKLIGDGMLVAFHAVEDAVRCAVAIQRGMRERNATAASDRQMEFRIGINIGDLLFEEGDVYGDGVNVAARIESLAKPGGVSVSSSVHDTLGGRLGMRFEDIGEQRLKNIARPVHVYNIVIDETVVPPSSQGVRENPPIKSNRTLLYVTRFVNLSGNPDQEYFAAGITQDVVAGLSRFSGLNVIVRLPRADPHQPALAAFYTLEGSVRRIGDRVRVNASLTDAEGEHIWAEKFDFGPIDMFDVQDELSRSIPAALNVKIEEAER